MNKDKFSSLLRLHQSKADKAFACMFSSSIFISTFKQYLYKIIKILIFEKVAGIFCIVFLPFKS